MNGKFNQVTLITQSLTNQISFKKPIGACLLIQLDAWRKIGAEDLVKQGI